MRPTPQNQDGMPLARCDGRNAIGQYLRGTSGSPGGSPKALRRVVNKAFLADMRLAWEKHGINVPPPFSWLTTLSRHLVERPQPSSGSPASGYGFALRTLTWRAAHTPPGRRLRFSRWSTPSAPWRAPAHKPRSA